MSGDQEIARFVTEALLPRWKDAGFDDKRGCFREQLQPNLNPLETGFNRLLVQCRQVFSFSEGSLMGCPSWALDRAVRGFRFFSSHYWDTRRGGWLFSLGEGAPLPSRYRQLYSHAFVLLACAAFYRATGERNALDCAQRTLVFIHEHFAAPQGGFWTSLDEALIATTHNLEQNSHMHLFEGCMMMFEVTGERDFAVTLVQIADLLIEKFVHPATGTLTEFFDREWRPDPEKGHLVEPGHHFEWMWLIRRWLDMAAERGIPTRSAELELAVRRLLAWAITYGLDPEYGGVFDVVDREGRVVKDSKRIWPATECVKALALYKDEPGVGEWRRRIAELLSKHYFIYPDGAWVESLTRELRPASRHLPASTIYHIVMAARELRRASPTGSFA